MHQHPRVPPRVSSPAASPQTNPTRTNNPREGGAPVTVPWRAGGNVPNVDNPPSPVPDAPSAESIKKLDQIVQVSNTKSAYTCPSGNQVANSPLSVIQNFFSKVAVLVIDSRIKVKHIKGPTGARKTSKWVSLVAITLTHTWASHVNFSAVPNRDRRVRGLSR